eukprot:scaffold650379_cov38-Prasinocladus_malaysianus.AAC.1
MPKSSRATEVRGLKMMSSIKSGAPASAERVDDRTDIDPRYAYVKPSSPAWSLPKNRNDKPKKWTPPRKLIEAHMY